MAAESRNLRDVIDDPASLLSYLKERGRNHNHFKYYGTYDTISKIVDKRHLLLSRGLNWNDTDDRRRFQTSLPGYVRFGTCLSFSVSENVAMWMLYGGTQRDGAMIDLRRADITAMMGLQEFELGHMGPTGFVREATFSEGCSLYPIDVLYVGENDDGATFAVRRSDESLRAQKVSPAFDGVLTKSYPWLYENEVRLVLDVPAGSVKDSMTHAWIPLGRSSEGLLQRAYLAPNSTRADDSYQRSRLQGRIDWDICRGCEFRPDH